MNRNRLSIRPTKRILDPRQLGDLRLWLDATQVVGLADNTEMSSITDLSGRGSTGTKAGGTGPHWRKSVLNGLPGIEFTPSGGSGGFFNFPNNFNPGSQGGHVFLVYQWKSESVPGGNEAGLWWFGTNEIALMPIWGDSNSQFYDDFARNRINFNRIPGGLTRPRLYEVASAANYWKNWYEGNLWVNTSGNFGFNTTPRFGRSNPNHAGDQYVANGYLGEILVYGEALSERTRQVIADHLVKKWRIS